jgi:hypothetical protein
VLAGLLIIIVGLTLFAAGPWPRPISPRRSAREWEMAAWRALWWPSVPVVAVISILIGWAIVEPAISDEHLSFSAVVMSAVFLGLWFRVVIRAVRALTSRADLAEAVLVAAKLHTSGAPGASLIEDSIGLEERINRLLAPVSGEDVQPRRRTAITLFSVSVVGVLSGIWGR